MTPAEALILAGLAAAAGLAGAAAAAALGEGAGAGAEDAERDPVPVRAEDRAESRDGRRRPAPPRDRR